MNVYLFYMDLDNNVLFCLCFLFSRLVYFDIFNPDASRFSCKTLSLVKRQWVVRFFLHLLYFVGWNLFSFMLRWKENIMYCLVLCLELSALTVKFSVSYKVREELWVIIYIYYWKLYFINNTIMNKSKVSLPHA